MIDLVLFVLQRFGLWMGLLLIGSSLFFAGLKFYEHFTYVPAQARVVAVSTKCDMSYRVAGRATNNEIVECSEVARMKARYPDIDWKVQQVAFVDISYSVDGRAIRTTVRRSKLERDTAAIGETIPILRSPGNPQVVTGPVNKGIVVMMGVLLAIGLALFGMSLWAKRKRDNGGYLAGGYA